MIGRTFGRLAVIEASGKDRKRQLKWLCTCECGNSITTTGYLLRSGQTRSCGCLRRDVVSERNYSHGMSNHRLYRTWNNMTARCENAANPQFKDYGGRGISICKEWADFYAFAKWALANGYSDELSIDRINNDAGYSPTNCRWATRIEQARNKRPRKDQKLTADDVAKIRSDPRHQTKIAADFSVKQQHVSRIKNRRRWASI